VTVWTSLIRNSKPGYDPMQRTRSEIRLRGDAISLYVNGVPVRSERCPIDRHVGVVGVLIQDLDAEVCAFEVVWRQARPKSPARGSTGRPRGAFT
jgi:hypothetical protein